MKGIKHAENPGEVSINEDPSRVVWESEHWIAILDKYPLVEGHVLILPKKEVSHITELDDAQLDSMGSAINSVSSKLSRTFGPGILVSIKCGKGSARTISHLHIHVIPRKKGDRLWDGDKSRVVLDRTSGFPRLNVSDEELKETARKIRGK
jgi:diadenosine tetraphosphate (Ap4A) HIT family hydrolase